VIHSNSGIIHHVPVPVFLAFERGYQVLYLSVVNEHQLFTVRDPLSLLLPVFLFHYHCCILFDLAITYRLARLPSGHDCDAS